MTDEIKLQQKAHEFGIGVGDLVEKLAEWFHVPKSENCGCARRKEIFNRLRIVGWKMRWADIIPETNRIEVRWMTPEEYQEQDSA